MSKEDYLRPNKATQFGKDNQPSPEAKSAGKKRKRILKEIAEQLITGKSKKALESLADYLGIEVDEIDLKLAMHIKMIEKVLKEGDVRAYNSIMDRLEGKPKQAIDHTTKGEKIQDRQFEVKIIPPPGDNE